jgi:hypothetical protein
MIAAARRLAITGALPMRATIAKLRSDLFNEAPRLHHWDRQCPRPRGAFLTVADPPRAGIARFVFGTGLPQRGTRASHYMKQTQQFAPPPVQ